jgi:hypothetical protein
MSRLGDEPTFAEAAASDEVAPIADLAARGCAGRSARLVDGETARWLEAAPAPARLIAARRRDPGGAPASINRKKPLRQPFRQSFHVTL